jgi:AraC family ethanolamine operon transcriptional activator
MNGEVLDERSMISLAPSESVVLAARAPNRWTSIFVPRDAFVSGVIGWDETAMATATGRSSVLPVDPTALDRVRCLALRLMRTAETVPRLLTYPAAARAADEELTAALFQTLGRIRRPRAGSAGRPSIPRRQLIARALEAAEADRGKSVYVRDLCRAAGVSERTLRNAFNEHFGFGPIHYLRVRRLHQWRAALRAADPRRDTVTGVGVRLGIWDFARLAQRYKALFGETPAQTLRACSLE